MAGVTFDGVSKIYADGTRAVNDLELEVQDSEFMVLVGPSGCGKSTALRMVAGLEDISEGVLKIGERVVNHVPPRDRDIAMVFQSYALYPHLSVYDNIAFGLKLQKMPKAQVKERVQRAAKLLGLEEHLNRKPRQLSGGQRQRVALGRAIVREPDAFLMDEPLSNLDAKLRVEMRAYVAQLHRRLAVAILRGGLLEQVDAPQTLYDRPASLFVAAFMGSPAMNLLRGRIVAEEDTRPVLELGSARLPLPDSVLEARPALMGRVDEEVVVGIRPEALRPADGARAALEGSVVLRESLGSDVLVHVEVDAPAVLAGEQLEAAREIGGGEVNGTPPKRARLTARLEPSVRAATGETLRLTVDPARLHFFDPQTERALA